MVRVAAPLEVPLELGGQRVTVELGHQLVGVVFLGIAAFFQATHVFGDLVVVLGHLGDRTFPHSSDCSGSVPNGTSM